MSDAPERIYAAEGAMHAAAGRRRGIWCEDRALLGEPCASYEIVPPGHAVVDVEAAVQRLAEIFPVLGGPPGDEWSESVRRKVAAMIEEKPTDE